MPGYYVTTTVTLTTHIYKREEVEQKRVDLINDPLYYQLIDYIDMNEPPHEDHEDHEQT
jgi:hypothetical protein